VAPRELLSEEGLISWILRYLGAPFVKVELGEDHIRDAIEDARRWFASKKGVRKFVFFDVVQGVSEYVLPHDVEVVLDVAFMGGSALTSEQIASAGFGPGYGAVDLMGGLAVTGTGLSINAYSVGRGSAEIGPLSSLTIGIQNVDQFSRVFSSELDWRQDGRVLRLFPTRGYPTGQILLECKLNQVVIEQLPERDHEILKRYAVVGCKKRLGRIRSKYPGGFPGAQNSFDLDGSALLDEARTEEEQLNIEIMETGFPMAFLLG